MKIGIIYNVPIYWTTILGGYGRMKTYETMVVGFVKTVKMEK